MWHDRIKEAEFVEFAAHESIFLFFAFSKLPTGNHTSKGFLEGHFEVPIDSVHISIAPPKSSTCCPEDACPEDA